MKKTVAEHLAEPAENLVEDAQALMAATANVAEQKVVEARERLAAAIEKGRQTWNRVQEKAVAGAKATDETIREYPYQTIAIAFGIGAAIGFLVSRRS
ncbi:MAG: DUF883 family protein [Limisphaerales bacterium]